VLVPVLVLVEQLVKRPTRKAKLGVHGACSETSFAGKVIAEQL